MVKPHRIESQAMRLRHSAGDSNRRHVEIPVSMTRDSPLPLGKLAAFFRRYLHSRTKIWRQIHRHPSKELTSEGILREMVSLSGMSESPCVSCHSDSTPQG